MMRKLPIGIQTFREIIDDDCLYVDKTGLAARLASEFKCVFLSRPRRFGKSLFLDTLSELFEGDRSLFRGLEAYEAWDWTKKHPVVRISWGGDFSVQGALEKMSDCIVMENKRRLGVEFEPSGDAAVDFRRLITFAAETIGERVVVLVDEYDKPILDALEDAELAKRNRAFLRAVYGVMKDCDRHLRFVFLTGVSKFSHASIFSGLNNLEDISLNPDYGTVCGYTQSDIDSVFAEALAGADMDKVREWYNGYNFLGGSVYNPFDILKFISGKFSFRGYWCDSGGALSFPLRVMRTNNYFVPTLSNPRVGAELLSSFDIERMEVETLLFQSGYLTIDKVMESPRGDVEYLLRIPNREVELFLSDSLLDFLTGTGFVPERGDLRGSLINGDVEALEAALKSLFAAIPYNNHVKNNIAAFEGYYASVVYAYLASLGLRVIGEDVTNRGRIDLTLLAGDKVYLLEFKIGEAEDAALRQLKERGYAEKYLCDYKNVFLVGMSFDESERNIIAFNWMRIE